MKMLNNISSEAREAIFALAFAFAALTIPTLVVWAIRTLMTVKELAEKTDTTLNGPMGVVSEVQRIRSNMQRINGVLTTHVGQISMIEEEVSDIKQSLSRRDYERD